MAETIRRDVGKKAEAGASKRSDFASPAKQWTKTAKDADPAAKAEYEKTSFLTAPCVICALGYNRHGLETRPPLDSYSSVVTRRPACAGLSLWCRVRTTAKWEKTG
jgi:hypothetical protein